MNTLDDVAYVAKQLDQVETSINVQGSTKLCHGLSDLTGDYDLFLVDQWGVLHDGHTPYAGVLDCLEQLRRAGKQVIIISNSGKRSASNETRLSKLGFPRNSYTHLVTSGEIAWQMMASGQGFFRDLIDSPCLLLTSDSPEDFAQGLSVSFVDNVEAAGMILLAGMDDARSQAFYENMIRVGVAKHLPLVCANPDFTRITSSGLQPGTGAIAQAYQAQGGTVYCIGKPYSEIYRYCLNLLPNVDASRVLAVGDSIHHDVAGGGHAGLTTLLTMHGVHADHFIDTTDPIELIQRIRIIAGPFGATPDWAMPTFLW